jgi:hypothetical protein
MFAPLDAAAAVDRLLGPEPAEMLRREKEGAEKGGGEGGELGGEGGSGSGGRGSGQPAAARGASGVGVAALLLQTVLLYAQTAYLKNGPEWRSDFTAVALALHIDVWASLAAGGGVIFTPPRFVLYGDPVSKLGLYIRMKCTGAQKHHPAAHVG